MNTDTSGNIYILHFVMPDKSIHHRAYWFSGTDQRLFVRDVLSCHIEFAAALLLGATVQIATTITAKLSFYFESDVRTETDRYCATCAPNRKGNERE